MKKVVVESSRLIFNDFFKIEEAMVSYERFNGTMSPVVRRLNFERGDSVAALLYDGERDRVILIKQFRYPAHEKHPGWIIETVAGMVEAGEEPQDTLRREVLEEAGYEIAGVEHISTFYVSPGGSSERIWLYYVEVTTGDRTAKGGGVLHENEDIEMVEMSPTEAIEAVAIGEIVDAKTIVALLWLQSKLLPCTS